jgi:hypothetical protein
MWRVAAAVLVGAIVVLARPISPLNAASFDVPSGYGVVGSEAIDAGVEHVVLRGEDPGQEVHVARVAPGAAGRLHTVLAGGALTGPTSGLETTSSMCARVRCLVAVNGEFADADRQPVGAMVSHSELVRTPGIEHAYLEFPDAGRGSVSLDFPWSVELSGGGLSVTAGTVNRAQGDDGLALYTARWGPRTGTPPGTTELVVELPPAGNAALPTGESEVRLAGLSDSGNSAIGPGQAVLSGRGASAGALSDLWQAASGNPLAQLLRLPTTGTLRVSTDGARDTIGGSPQLLRNGDIAFPDGNDDSFTQDRHPRTMVGITPGGEVLLVTVDGRQPGHSAGLSLVEAADLLRGLGAVDAINLDGGGSTTFVAGGEVRNRPSDPEGERRVVSILALEPEGSEVQPPTLSTPAASRFAPLPLQDPASRPPNLLGDLLPPLQKAIAPIVEPLVDALDRATAPATDVVTDVANRMVAATRQAMGSLRPA